LLGEYEEVSTPFISGSTSSHAARHCNKKHPEIKVLLCNSEACKKLNMMWELPTIVRNSPLMHTDTHTHTHTHTAPHNDSRAGDTLSSRHTSSCDINACSWYVRGNLTLNSLAQIHTSVTLLTSRDLVWSSGRLMCQHASQIFAVVHISWDMTYVLSALQTLPVVSRNGGNAYWKVHQWAFLYDTKSPEYTDQHMRANTWEGIGKELKIKYKFYVSSRDVRIVCPWLSSHSSTTTQKQPFYVAQLSTALIVVHPTAVTCFAHTPITQQSTAWSHGIKGKAFQTHSHSSERSKLSFDSRE
jgi:hypothetical protein